MGRPDRNGAAANDSIAEKLGLLHPGKGTNTVRAVFIVDPKEKFGRAGF
ncbi:MAG: hypothetical protein SAMD01599839_16720 [Rectinema sp.]